jgi:hypothetical protein
LAERDSDAPRVARDKTERGGPLTREQAGKARRSIRRAFLIAVVQTVLGVAAAAIAYPRALTVIGPLAAVYLVAVPFLLRYLERDIQRRVVPSSTQNKPAERAFGSDR